MRVFVIGASGGVGRAVLAEAAARGWEVAAQTRDAAKLADLADRVSVVECAPDDGAALAAALPGRHAVVFALGVDRLGATTVFSDATRALIPAMAAAGVDRLVAVTGVGAGETRGHGGWFYDRVIFPLLTRLRYEDKDRQEALIAASGLDWTVVRPAVFASRVPDGPLEVHETVPPGLALTRITREEVARFVLDCVETGAHSRASPFIGHP